ncbi:hypothetical protein VM98_23415 [Streptomyces rubellomurinus subsp. indigoferus]|nr:hypothetical protein VM98_23415 [Streptomyces rubellomurinus subsp. indigoferus]
MAGQRARTPYQDAGPRTEDAAVPAQRSRAAGAAGSADGGGTAAGRAARVGRAGASRRRPQPTRRGRAAAVLLAAVGLPVLGGAADELGGPGVGLLFAVGAVAGTGAAAALCSRAGRWWVVTAAPIVVLLAASGVEYVAHSQTYRGHGLGTGALRWVVGAFPVMATATAAALLVIAVRAGLERRRPAAGAPTGRGRRG